jgi:hypothetical protein
VSDTHLAAPCELKIFQSGFCDIGPLAELLLCAQQRRSRITANASLLLNPKKSSDIVVEHPEPFPGSCARKVESGISGKGDAAVSFLQHMEGLREVEAPVILHLLRFDEQQIFDTANSQQLSRG